MKDLEKEILRNKFIAINFGISLLEKKEPFINIIEPGDVLLIDNSNSSNPAVNAVSYIGVVEKVLVEHLDGYHGIQIPVAFQKGKCKELIFYDDESHFSPLNPQYQNQVDIHPHSRLHRRKYVVGKVLKTKYKTSFAESGL